MATNNEDAVRERQKYKALQLIVEQQDKYIKDLESTKGSVSSSHPSNYGEEETKSTIDQNMKNPREISAHHVTAIDKVMMEHKQKEQLWQKERELLQSLLERSRGTNKRLEKTLSQERQEMERRIQRDVESLMLTKKGASDSTVVRSLQGELKRATKRCSDMQDQVQDLSRRLVEQNDSFTALLEREKRMAVVEKRALQDKLEEALNTVQQGELRRTSDRDDAQTEVSHVKQELLERERAHRAAVKAMEQQVHNATQALLEYSRGARADAKHVSTTGENESLYTENPVASSSKSSKNGTNSVSIVPVLMPNAMREEFEKRLMDVLKAKEMNETKLCAERQQLLEDVEQHDHQRDERIKIIQRDATLRLKEAEAFVALLEKRNTILEQQLDTANNLVLRSSNNAKEREAAAISEINGLKIYFEAKLKSANDMVEDGREVCAGLEQMLNQKQIQIAEMDTTHQAQTDRYLNVIEQLKRQAQVIAARHTHTATREGGFSSPASRSIGGMDTVTNYTDDIPVRTVHLDGSTATTHALAGEISSLRMLHNQCQHDLEHAKENEVVLRAEFEKKLARQSEQAYTAESHADEVVAKYHRQAAEQRKAMKSAHESQLSAQEQSLQHIETWRSEAQMSREWASQVEANAAAALKATEEAATEQSITHQNHTRKLRTFLLTVQDEFTRYRIEAEAERTRMTAEIERMYVEQRQHIQMIDDKEKNRQRTAVAHMATRAVLEQRLGHVEEELKSSRERCEELQGLDALGDGLVDQLKRGHEIAQGEMKRLEIDLEDSLKQLNERVKQRSEAMSAVMSEVASLRNACAGHHQHVQQVRHEAFAQASALKAERNAVEARVDAEVALMVNVRNGLDAQARAMEEAAELLRETVQIRHDEMVKKTAQAEELKIVAERRLVTQERRSHVTQEQLQDQLQSLGRVSRKQEAGVHDASALLQDQMELSTKIAQEKVKELTEENERLKRRAERAREYASETEQVAEKELGELHAEVKQLRRGATDAQTTMAREKQVLVEQVQELKTRTAHKQSHASKVFKAQVNTIKDQESTARKLSEDAVQRAQAQVSATREQMNAQAEQYVKDVRSLQQGLSILRSMEDEREKHMKKELNTIRDQLSVVHKHARTLGDSQSHEMTAMEEEIASLRHACERSEEGLVSQSKQAEERRQSFVRRLDVVSSSTATAAAEDDDGSGEVKIFGGKTNGSFRGGSKSNSCNGGGNDIDISKRREGTSSGLGIDGNSNRGGGAVKSSVPVRARVRSSTASSRAREER